MKWVGLELVGKVQKAKKPCTSDFLKQVFLLNWDGENMRFTNIGNEEMIITANRDNFVMKDGLPRFEKDGTESINANEFTAELITGL